ncbi:flagellar brake protein [Klebsiella pneumoniae]
MSDGHDTELHDVHAADAADERFLVRNPRQLRQLLRSLIDQRSLINAHIDGRDRSFPTALLDLDEDEDYLLLDGSPQEASNRAAEQADHLLCFAQLERVLVRFRLHELQRVDNDGHVAFRAPLPDELVHLQRRELYRLETPVTDSPHLLLPPGEARAEALSMRVVATRLMRRSFCSPVTVASGSVTPHCGSTASGSGCLAFQRSNSVPLRRASCSSSAKPAAPCEWKDRSGSLPRALDGSGRLMWYCAGMEFSLKCGKTGTTAVESMCRFRPWPALIRTDAAHRRSLR